KLRAILPERYGARRHGLRPLATHDKSTSYATIRCCEGDCQQPPWKLPELTTKRAAHLPRQRVAGQGQCRRLRHISRAILASSGRSTTPFSVTMQSTRSAGVTSKIGLITGTSAATLCPSCA